MCSELGEEMTAVPPGHPRSCGRQELPAHAYPQQALQGARVASPQVMPDHVELTEWLAKLEATAEKEKAGAGGVDGGALVSQLRKDNFASVCPESAALCVIAVVRKRLGPDAVKLLQEVASKATLRQARKGAAAVSPASAASPGVHYCWADVQQQVHLSRSFGIDIGGTKGEVRTRTHARDHRNQTTRGGLAVQVNSRTQAHQKLKCLISLCTNLVSILSVPIQTVR